MNSRKCTALVLVALVVLALAPAANAAIDYSKNAAGGAYAPAVTLTTTPTVSEPAATDDSGFAWGAAAIGAGTALALVLLSVPVLRLKVRRDQTVVG